MIVNELTSNILANELQLGSQLNECIHDNRRSHFSLMLAMLTEDVREHAQFLLPKIDNAEKTTNDNTLRKFFNVNEPAPLALKNMEQINDFNQADLIVNNTLTELRLHNVLNPMPLAFRDDHTYINTDVINNTSVHCQQRLSKENKDSTKTPRLNFKAEEWLNVINESILSEKITA